VAESQGFVGVGSNRGTARQVSHLDPYFPAALMARTSIVQPGCTKLAHYPKEEFHQEVEKELMERTPSLTASLFQGLREANYRTGD